MKCFAMAVLAAGVATSASGETTLLDIPSGDRHDVVWASSTTGFLGDQFTISSQYIAFSEDNWATPGNVYAWDWDTYTSRVGSIRFDGIDGALVRLASLDVSGWGNYLESAANLRVFADGELVWSNDLFFAGNAGFDTIDFSGTYASSYEIQLENIGQWASVGLDNIVIESMNVPAPGALALLGLAGVVGTRRRRG